MNDKLRCSAQIDQKSVKFEVVSWKHNFQQWGANGSGSSVIRTISLPLKMSVWAAVMDWLERKATRRTVAISAKIEQWSLRCNLCIAILERGHILTCARSQLNFDANLRHVPRWFRFFVGWCNLAKKYAVNTVAWMQIWRRAVAWQLPWTRTCGNAKWIALTASSPLVPTLVTRAPTQGGSQRFGAVIWIAICAYSRSTLTGFRETSGKSLRTPWGNHWTERNTQMLRRRTKQKKMHNCRGMSSRMAAGYMLWARRVIAVSIWKSAQ